MHVAEARFASGQRKAQQLCELLVQAWFQCRVWRAVAARWSLLPAMLAWSNLEGVDLAISNAARGCDPFPFESQCACSPFGLL